MTARPPPAMMATGRTRQWLLFKLSPWWSCQADAQKLKDTNKLHLLKITKLFNLCHQRTVIHEKTPWDPYRGFNPPHELRQVALLKKDAWKLRLEEGGINLGRDGSARTGCG